MLQVNWNSSLNCGVMKNSTEIGLLNFKSKILMYENVISFWNKVNISSLGTEICFEILIIIIEK